jgi:hypothetical protein
MIRPSLLAFPKRKWLTVSPIARVIPIPYFIFKGSLVDPRLRASNDIHAPSKLARIS